MSRARCLSTALALAALALVPAAGFADPAAKTAEPDEELLEFLGTVDLTADVNAQPDDGSWIDYLSQTDIDGAAQGKAAKKASPPGPAGAKPSAPDAQGSDTKTTGAPKVKSDDR